MEMNLFIAYKSRMNLLDSKGNNAIFILIINYYFATCAICTIFAVEKSLHHEKIYHNRDNVVALWGNRHMGTKHGEA